MNQNVDSSPESNNSSKIEPRLVSTIVSVKDILQSEFITRDGWEPNFIKPAWGEPIYRVHLVGTIIEKQDTPQRLVLDDGESSIELRSFDPIANFEKIDVGNLVRVIGRPRQFNDVLYIHPEIIVTLTSPDLVRLHQAYKDYFEQSRVHEIIHDDATKVVHSDIAEQADNGDELLLDLIESLDKGDGVDVSLLHEQLKKKMKAEHPEKIVDRLLLHGDIFEIQPGKIKVLR